MSTTPQPDWAVTNEKVEQVIRKIIEIGKPRKIILFGSFVKGTMTAHSDLDVLVVTGNDISNPRTESVRIRRALRDISMPMDILVVPEERWMQLKDQPGLIYRQAMREGRIVYDG
jgi:predicted nucleotidyltransferase